MQLKSSAYVLALVLCSNLLASCTHRLILEDVPKHFPEISKNIPTITKKLSEIQEKLPRILTESGMQVYFVKTNGKTMELVGVKRNLIGASKVEAAVKALLDGPSNEESSSGLGSEIPRGTILLGVKAKDSEIEIDLSRRFATDGGTDSFETRLEQLSRTVSAAESTQPVYLNVEGSRLNMTQGEGIEVKQPINR